MKTILLAILILVCSSSLLTAQTHKNVISSEWGGGQVTVGTTTWRFLTPDQVIGITTPPGTGDVLEASWNWSPPTGNTIRIHIKLERSATQSHGNHERAFTSMVESAMGYFPPNTDGLAAASSGRALALNPEGNFSASWQHDRDGAGPLKPITITVSTDKKDGESLNTAAERFARMVDAMLKVFPSNT